MESESSLARRSAEAQQPQTQPIIAGPPLQPRAHDLHTPCWVGRHFPPYPRSPPARTEPRGGGLPPSPGAFLELGGSSQGVSAPRASAPGEEEAGSGPSGGLLGLGARRGSSAGRAARGV